MIGLGFEVEASRKAIVWENSSLGSRVRVGQMCQNCESEISFIMLMVDLRVVDISGLMSFLTWIRLAAHRVVNDCDLGKVIAYTPNGI